MEEFLLVPAKEDPREVARVKGELTDNARLTYAGELGAKKRRLLKDPSLTPDAKMIKLLPVSKALARETRRIRQFKVPDTETEEEEEEDTELLTPALDKWMRRMVKTMGNQTKWQKRLEALNRGMLVGYKSMRPPIPLKPKWMKPTIKPRPKWMKPPISPKPKKLQFDTPSTNRLPPKQESSGRTPRPFKAEDLSSAMKALKPVTTDEGKGKGKGKSPLQTALETALALKFDSSKDDDTDEEESDEEDDWSRRLRPRPTKPPKTWEEW